MNIITNLIDNYNHLYSSEEIKNKQQSSDEIKNKLLNLILTEKLYNLESRNHYEHSSSELYINQLKSFINEESRTYYLADFLQEVISYCVEYYHELNIVLEPIKNDQTFSFKHVALCETLFSIFTLILRIGQFTIDTEQITVRGFFDNSNKFPTIVIEANIIGSADFQALGWSSGVSYIYSGLFTVYELAKKNSLFFYTEQVEQKVFFIIEPISEERLID